jgi:hypothetical protein
MSTSGPFKSSVIAGSVLFANAADCRSRRKDCQRACVSFNNSTASKDRRLAVNAPMGRARIAYPAVRLISTAAALARALAARAAAVVQTTAFRRRALQVAVQSAAKRFRRGFIPRQLNLPALAGKSLRSHTMFDCR